MSAGAVPVPTSEEPHEAPHEAPHVEEKVEVKAKVETAEEKAGFSKVYKKIKDWVKNAVYNLTGWTVGRKEYGEDDHAKPSGEAVEAKVEAKHEEKKADKHAEGHDDGKHVEELDGMNVQGECDVKDFGMGEQAREKMGVEPGDEVELFDGTKPLGKFNVRALSKGVLAKAKTPEEKLKICMTGLKDVHKLKVKKVAQTAAEKPVAATV